MEFDELFSGIADSILHEFEKSTSAESPSGYSLIKGFRKFLEGHIPSGYGISSGNIIDTDGTNIMANIIIYDKLLYAKLEMNTTKIFPIEVVYAILKVVPNLRKKEFEDCLNINRNLKGLSKTIRYRQKAQIFINPMFMIYAMKSAPLHSLVFQMYDFHERHQLRMQDMINLVCVNNAGLILFSDVIHSDIRLYPVEKQFARPLFIGKYSLMFANLLLSIELSKMKLEPPKFTTYLQKISSKFGIGLPNFKRDLIQKNIAEIRQQMKELKTELKRADTEAEKLFLQDLINCLEELAEEKSSET